MCDRSIYLVFGKPVQYTVFLSALPTRLRSAVQTQTHNTTLVSYRNLPSSVATLHLPATMVSSLSSLLECLSPNTTIATAPRPLEYHITVESILGPSMLDGPYPDFGVHIVDGVVWFWLLEQWQDLPNELWAWKHVTVWTKGHYYYGCRIWVPSLLLFDFWAYDLSSYSRISASITDHPRVPGPPAAAVIAPRLFEVLRSSDDSELCRTCRLVCRDWANACPLRDPERCNLWFRWGSVWYWIEEKWQYLPSKYWAWTPQWEEWWVDRWEAEWYLKLVQPVDDAVRRNPRYSSVLSLPPSSDSTSTRSGSLTAALPPELLQYICEAADNGSSSSRLVCQQWNRLCTPRVYERVDVKKSPERIRALWRHRADPVMRHVEVVEGIPRYYKSSKFPWVHLLTEACASTRSVWKDVAGDQEEISILGPFAGGHRTIRSVHFALPRSLPRSLSRGIKSLWIDAVTFRKIEDLAHLVCELPDLETLHCGLDTIINSDSLPIELPRRRPRTNCNKLREVRLVLDEDDLLEIALTVYLSVYDAMSFFSDGEITIILALLKPLHRLIDPEFCYHYDPDDHSHRLYSGGDLDYASWSLQIVRDLPQNHGMLNFVLDCSRASEDLDCWTQFDKIKGLISQANFVFGFGNRKRMKAIATDILKNMPSMSKFATVRYSIYVVDEPDRDDGWYQASLHSEELTGTPKKDLADVYS